ncbi:rhamnosyltransferase [Faunimonas pinastri]|uniref:Rhamnosyltransferase n=1 Tax=Faunimonas pinastri TaxID=1855383 RepID=A0A1H9PML4_9HYPH|nr:rhamnan synthesis F family protein [Faunimonas pinastri]SER49501.1 rhamnosyltransferase [Faunimonas pinastri]
MIPKRAPRSGLGLRRRIRGLQARLLPRAVVICHCHYPELVAELRDTLDRLPGGIAVHVTSSDPEVLRLWRERWHRPDLPLTTHRTENRGRDISPFFQVARGLRTSPHTPVLKIHGKKSTYTDRGAEWRHDLLSGLVPDRQGVRAILKAFRTDPRLGMIGAPGSYTGRQVYWGGNRPHVEALMRSILGRPAEDDELGFFAGSMFWIRGSLLARILPFIDDNDFPEEGGQQDGTYAHALERVIPMAARGLGYTLQEADSGQPLTPDQRRDREVVYI